MKQQSNPLVTLATQIGLVLLRPWFVMVGLAALHDVYPPIPALGYWTVFLVLLGAGSAMETVRRPPQSSARTGADQ